MFLGANRNFSASIGSFQGLPAGTSEVILLSQRLALKYNTTPPDDCQHFLTSFFQFLCGGAEPSQSSLRDARFPLLSPAMTFSPRPGEICPLGGSWRAAPERVQPYIITLYRQSKSQPGIDGGLYYPPESALRCQDFPCKILSRKISTIFGDCYKTQNIVVFCLTCH